MAHYILIGGNWKFAGDRGTSLCSTLAPYVSQPATILICLFGLAPHTWGEHFQRIVSVFESHLDQVSYQLAQPESFIKQIQTADVVYLNDGDNLLTERVMHKFRDLTVALQDKVVVGSSAGANILATAYYTRTYGMVRDGLGVLPIKLITHYGSVPDNAVNNLDWEAAKQQLSSYGNSALPLYTVSEGKFIELNEAGSRL